MSIRIPNARALALCDLHADAVDAGAGPGILQIYTGVVPADADSLAATAPSDTLLAQLTMQDPAFQAAVDNDPGARAVANPITGDTAANASGTAGWARLTDSNGVIVHIGNVTQGGGGGFVDLVTNEIVAGQPVNVTSMNLDVPEA